MHRLVEAVHMSLINKGKGEKKYQQISFSTKAEHHYSEPKDIHDQPKGVQNQLFDPHTSIM